MRPATRARLRPWLLLALLVLTAIYLTTGARSTQTSEFYTRTVKAMEAQRKAVQEGLGTMSERTAAREQEAAEAKVREGKGEIVFKQVPDHEGGKGEQVANRGSDKGDATTGSKKQQQPLADDEDDTDATKRKPKPKPKAKSKPFENDEAEAIHGPVDADDKAGRKKVTGKGKGDGDDGVAKVGNTDKHVSENKDGSEEHETAADHKVEVLLNGILKKSPIIIFSKSYCPYSKKAKHILLENYKIVPAPFVHEIDLMEDEKLAKRLQDKLFKMTKRRTVPNVLIHGVSIGGGDDVAALDANDALIAKIKEIGGKRIMEVSRVSGGKESVKFKA